MGTFFVGLLVRLIVGAVIGLVPFVLGRYMRKQELGQLGMLCCAISALLHISLPLLLAIGFTIAIFLMKRDIHIPGRTTYGQDVPATGPAYQIGRGRRNSSMSLTCLSGPLKGRTYRVGVDGLMFGRDNDCAVRFPAETPGVSRHHCCIRWQRGEPILVDLNSAYGTFLADGRQLPPNFPTVLTMGSSFYLSSGGYRFQVTAM